jgi:hypothetical protein
VAKGKFDVPDDIDECNDEIAEMFGVNEYFNRNDAEYNIM